MDSFAELHDEVERLRTLIRAAVYDAILATHSVDMDEVRRVLERLRDAADNCYP